MNERIREIAKQAYIADASKLPNWKFKPETEFLLKQLGGFNEKFAELMVEQFDRILVNEYLDCVGENDTKSQFRIDRLRERVKEYFGVEK